MTTFVLAGNGSYDNRGCEAIVRGSVEILRRAFEAPRFVVSGFGDTRSSSRRLLWDDDITDIPIPLLRESTLRGAGLLAIRRTMPYSLTGRILFSRVAKYLPNCEAVLSVGGDNYTFDYGFPDKFIALDRYVKSFNKPLVIWGASIGPFNSRPKTAEFMHCHLRDEVDAIFVREQRSFEYLEENGVTNNVYITADPAFVMPAKEVHVDRLENPISDDAIGLNLSSLVMPSTNHEIWYQEGSRMVEAMLRRFDRSIVLIPHVVGFDPRHNDHLLLNEIRRRVRDDDRIQILPDDLSASETKWVISKLSGLVAARTHATIASISSCVPTISIAYSTKAYGLNSAIFGHEKYLIHARDLNPRTIVEKTELMLSESEGIRDTLAIRIPEMQRQAFASGEILRDQVLRT